MQTAVPTRPGAQRPAAEPQTEALRSCGPAPCKLVTSARFAKRSGRGREGERADRQPAKRNNRALVTAVLRIGSVR
jgi:hypothetical protein